MGKKNVGGVYAVARGHRPGIYETWDDTKKQVEGFRNARHKKFQTRAEAIEFIQLHNASGLSNLYDFQNDQAARQGGVPGRPQVSTPQLPVSNNPLRLPSDSNDGSGIRLPIEELRREPLHLYVYAVAKGRIPGVYMSWKEAEEQVKDLYSAKFKKFSTIEDAQQYVDDYQRSIERLASDPHPMHPDTLIAFCDGSAVKNGKHGCRAGWGLVFPHNPEWNAAAPLAHSPYQASNNRAEYMGAIEAIKRANLVDPAKRKPLYICTDSQLLLRSMTEWCPDWKENGWKKADGSPVRNPDLLKRLLELQGERRIIWRFVKAHTNRTDWWSKWNDLADQMAREQTHNRQRPHERPPFPDEGRRTRRRMT